MEFPAALISTLRRAKHIVVLTGAGISAESGIPTFRQAQTGLWARYDVQQLATPSAFRHNPRLVWEWYAWRRSLCARAEPNPAHYALAQLERQVPRFTLITQNVDNLHQRAGSHNLIEIHGNIFEYRCFDENTPIETWPATDELPPRCPRCGGPIRPAVVWFGERLPETALNAALAASSDCDLFLSIGTSGVVEPAASLPWIAWDRGAAVAVINPEGSPVVRPNVYPLIGNAGQIMPQLVQLLSHNS